ncbi:Pks, partial [Streptomyces coelicoflavus ZG0656]
PHRVDLPRLPVVSPRTGRWMTEDEGRDPAVWTGPAGATASWDALLDGTGRHAVRLTPPDGEPGGLTHLLTLAADQWVLGATLDFTAVHTGRDIRRVPLPTHRFERRRHWVEPGEHGTRPETAAAGDRLIARFDPADPEHNVELIREHLTESIGKVLGGRHLAAPDTNLFDLGLDSLVLIEVVAKLAEELGFEVQATSFVEFPTIRSFVDNLAELMGLAPGTAPGGDAPAPRTSRR